MNAAVIVAVSFHLHVAASDIARCSTLGADACNADHVLGNSVTSNKMSILLQAGMYKSQGFVKPDTDKSVAEMNRTEIEGHFGCTYNGKASLQHKHMSKCGGTTMLHLLPQMAGRKYCEVGEEDPLTNKSSEHAFTIAGVRNPCDYYVSLWSYQHGKPWAHEQNSDCNCFDFQDDKHGDVKKFAKWLKLVSGGKHGIMTYRFWETLMAKKHGLSCWANNLPTCASSFNDTEVDISFSVEAFPPKTVDCWLYGESFEVDIKRCLSEYELKSDDALDWKPFYKEMKNVDHNPSRHKTCKDYYTPELAALVMKKDKHMFDAFGYNKCCGPPDGSASV